MFAHTVCLCPPYSLFITLPYLTAPQLYKKQNNNVHFVIWMAWAACCVCKPKIQRSCCVSRACWAGRTRQWNWTFWRRQTGKLVHVAVLMCSCAFGYQAAICVYITDSKHIGDNICAIITFRSLSFWHTECRIFPSLADQYERRYMKEWALLFIGKSADERGTRREGEQISWEAKDVMTPYRSARAQITMKRKKVHGSK